MELIRTQPGEEFARTGASLIAQWLRDRPDALLVPAIGRTPTGIYSHLVDLHRASMLDTRRLRVAQLDEYLGVGVEDPRSLIGWLLRDLCDPLGVEPEGTIRLDATADDPSKSCRAYEDAVKEAGGIDIAILGLGRNGHIGFNEPPSGPDARTRVVDLSLSSRRTSRGYWTGSLPVPSHALTAGMDLLLGARRTLVVVSGADKKAILRRTLHGPQSPDVPASLLRSIPGVTLLADEQAWPDTSTSR